ncbi:MAG: polyprenyl synthetase family protein [Candidatus Micrarchaeota archaeon]
MGIMNDLESEIPKIDAHFKKIIPQGSNNIVCTPIWDLLNRGGKRFRPVMCLLSCEAVGGKPGKALHTAAIIELFHNFTLIHDDIEDNSLMRRGKPCVHKIYGVPTTINSGDGMLLYTLKALEVADEQIRKILYDCFIQVLDGQGIELDWNTKKTYALNEQDYLKMVGMKTGALISSACQAGGIIGGGSTRQVSVLKTYGMAVGTAFQIQDDILNITGKENLYKKEIGGDITEGKRTLMTIHALNHAKRHESKELLSILNSNTHERTKISRVIEILEKNNSITHAEKKARDIVKNAKRRLSILPRNNSTDKLLRLADFLIEREF